MAEFPAMPFFTDAYLGDTRHLSTVQHGAYCLMLMTAWRSPDCALPDDDIQLSRITGLDRRTWAKNKNVLMAFWKLSEQRRWTQKRLLDERNYVERMRNKNSQAGKSSALKRKNRGSTSVQPAPDQNPTPIPTLTPTPSQKGAKALLTPTPLPDWLPVAQWGAFKEMRNGMKTKMTHKAEELIIGELAKLREKGHDPTAVLEQSIRNSWKDVYPVKGEKNGTNRRHGGFEQQDYHANTSGFTVG